MTDYAKTFVEPTPNHEPKKHITLNIYQRLRLGEWIKSQANSPLTYAQLANFATAELDFTVTPSHVENMWRGLNGRRKEERQEAPVLTVVPLVPEGMVLVAVEDLHHLHEINRKHEYLRAAIKDFTATSNTAWLNLMEAANAN